MKSIKLAFNQRDSKLLKGCTYMDVIEECPTDVCSAVDTPICDGSVDVCICDSAFDSICDPDCPIDFCTNDEGCQSNEVCDCDAPDMIDDKDCPIDFVLICFHD